MLKCPLCPVQSSSAVFAYDALLRHIDLDCPWVELDCPYLCGERFLRKEYQKHVSKACNKAVVKCEKCEEDKRVNGDEKHDCIQILKEKNRILKQESNQREK
jgi:hypothetical protein